VVRIQCPHCDGHIELDDDAQGLFDCPHCHQEFEWGNDAPPSDELPLFVAIDGMMTKSINASKIYVVSLLVEFILFVLLVLILHLLEGQFIHPKDAILLSLYVFVIAFPIVLSIPLIPVFIYLLKNRLLRLQDKWNELRM